MHYISQLGNSTNRDNVGDLCIGTYVTLSRGLSLAIGTSSLSHCMVQLVGYASTATDRNTRRCNCSLASAGLYSTTGFSSDNTMYGRAGITKQHINTYSISISYWSSSMDHQHHRRHRHHSLFVITLGNIVRF